LLLSTCLVQTTIRITIIDVLERGAGLPHLERITLDDVKDDVRFTFAVGRKTGCEYYQLRLIMVEYLALMIDE
jgi:hypothetical protein